MIIHTAIIDDDPVNVDDLKTKLELFCPEVIIVAALSSFSGAVSLLEGVHFDLLFIKYSPNDFDESDVRSAFADVDFSIIWMIGIDGNSFQLPEESTDDSVLIPVPAKDLRLSVTHVIELLSSKKHDKSAEDHVHSTHNHRLTISEKRSLIFIHIPDILYFQSDGNYTKVVFTKNNCNKETILASKNLLHFETRVISFDFVRIHQSILVNCAKISRIEKKSAEVILTDGTILPIARDRKKDVLLRLLR